jgi:hypothetical protein
VFGNIAAQTSKDAVAFRVFLRFLCDLRVQDLLVEHPSSRVRYAETGKIAKFAKKKAMLA